MEKKKYPSFSANSIWEHLNSKNPTDIAFNPDGTLNSISDNPMMEMDERSGYAKNDGMFVNTQLLAEWAVPWVKGLSFGTMFNYRLNVKLDYYYKYTSSLIYDIPIPGSLYAFGAQVKMRWKFPTRGLSWSCRQISCGECCELANEIQYGKKLESF